MPKPVHYEHELLYKASYAGACGVYSDKHEYTVDDRQVTCRKCLKALGYTVN